MSYNPIPDHCPKCGEYETWQEVKKSFFANVPILKNIRRNSKYHCGKCGFEKQYNLDDIPRDLRNSGFFR